MLGWVFSGSWGGRRELRRGLADFVLALSLFWVAAFVVSGSDIRAHAIPLRVLSKQVIRPDVAFPSRASMPGDEIGDPFFDLRSPETVRVPALAMVLLSMAFAALVAGNLAFWRHCVASMPPRGATCGGGVDGSERVFLPPDPLLHTLTNLRYMISESADPPGGER